MDITEFKSLLFDRVASKGDLQEVLDTASRFLGTPLHVTDASYKLIVASQTLENPDPLWLELMSNGYFSEDTIKKFFSSRLAADITSDPGPIFFEALGFPYIITPVLLDGDRVASLTALVKERRDIERLSDYLEALSRFLQNALLIRDMRMGGQSGRAELFLKALLDGHTYSTAAIQERSRCFGFRPEESYAVLHVCADASEQIGFPALHFKSIVPHYFPLSLSVYYRNAVVILLRFSQYSWYDELDLSEVEQYLQKYAAHGCLSAPFSGLEQLSGAYQRTLRLLSIRRYLSPDRRILRYPDFALYDLLENASSIMDLTAVCHPSVLYLHRYDRENGSEYVDTLYHLLTCRKKQDVQSALFIHRNTLNYRLEKIEGLIHIPWTNPDALLSMALSCRIVHDFLV